MDAAESGYYQLHQLTDNLAGEQIQFVSKRGIADWDQISPAAQLLAKNMYLQQQGRVLLLGCGHGALGVFLARKLPDAEIWMADHSAIALQVAEKTARANRLSNSQVSDLTAILPDYRESFHLIAIEAPNNRKLARRWIAEAYQALRPGGALYLAGQNDHGVQSIINDGGALFGNSTVLDYKKRNRIARFVKAGDPTPQPSWLREPGIAPGTWYTFTATVREFTLELASLPGVFSYDRIDTGTELLLQHLNFVPGAAVLDIGCGYGVIGIVASRLGAAHVDMVDVNVYAVAAARENIVRHDLVHTQAFLSDGLSEVRGRAYDLVISNPPFHTGKSVEYDMARSFIEESKDVISRGGSLLIVANRFIRYDHIMKEVFGNVECVAENKKFHVLSSTL